jgi:hypothetical protein
VTLRQLVDARAVDVEADGARELPRECERDRKADVTETDDRIFSFMTRLFSEMFDGEVRCCERGLRENGANDQSS